MSRLAPIPNMSVIEYIFRAHPDVASPIRDTSVSEWVLDGNRERSLTVAAPIRNTSQCTFDHLTEGVAG